MVDEVAEAVAQRLRTSPFDGDVSADEDLEELSAAVLDCLRRVPDSEAADDPQGILFSIASKVAASRRAKSSTAVDPATQETTRLFLQKVVQELEPRRRDILLLHVNDGLTYKQIATRLGLQPQYVIRELMRAYCTLRWKTAGTHVI